MMAVSGGQQWQLAAAGSNQQRTVVDSDAQTIDKVNGERINWCEMRRIVVKKYNIKGGKIVMK